jgi:hypothetical protein
LIRVAIELEILSARYRLNANSLENLTILKLDAISGGEANGQITTWLPPLRLNLLCLRRLFNEEPADAVDLILTRCLRGERTV